jgi:hypothetical protein
MPEIHHPDFMPNTYNPDGKTVRFRTLSVRKRYNGNKNPNKDVLFGYCRRFPVCTVASPSADRPLLKARHHPVVCAG